MPAAQPGRELGSALLKLHEDNAPTLTPIRCACFTTRTRRHRIGARRAGRCGDTDVERTKSVGLVVGRPWAAPDGRAGRWHPPGVATPEARRAIAWSATASRSPIGRRGRGRRQVLPRRNLLFRQDEWRTKSFAANLDQLLVLVAAEPMYR